MSLIQGKLWLRGIFFAPSGLQFCSDCCVQRSTGYSGKDVGYWHSTGSAFLITGAVQGGVYFICILMSISGDSGSSPPSWDRLTPPLEASFPSPERKPVLVWPLMGSWSGGKESLPWVSEKPGSAVCPTHWAQVLGGKSCSGALSVTTALRVGVSWCPSEMKATIKCGNMGLTLQ